MSNARNLARLLPNNTGQLPASNIADGSVTRTKIGYTGGVLQVVSNTNDTSFTIGTNATAQNYYALNTSVTLTSTYANSKFLIFGSQPGYCDGSNGGVGLGFWFNSTLLVGQNGGSGNSWAMFGNTISTNASFNLNHHTLHSPFLAAGTPITVTLAGAAWSRGSGQGNIFFNYNNNTSGAASLYAVRATITVLELQP